MNELRISESATVKAAANAYRVNVTLSSVCKKYLEASKKGNNALNNLYAKLAVYDINKEMVKTNNFNINTEYEWVDNKRVFVGYRYRHELFIEFELDNEKLSKVMMALEKATDVCEFSISFFVKDSEQYKDEALKIAIEKCMCKAELISKCANVKLKQIIGINHSNQEDDFVVQPMARMMKVEDCGSNMNMDIQAGDFEISDQITMIWSIE